MTSGSSPRTWGTPRPPPRAPGPSRFIPTHVGNTRDITDTCGIACGSSPRTWGTHRQTEQVRHAARFIPTHVGNTALPPRALPPPPVHPHARGEHVAGRGYARASSGSSPRTWGTLAHLHRVALAGRFIPTHVGNTQPAARAQMAATVHPHARGEHIAPFSGPSATNGSSPRTWGTQSRRRIPRRCRRFIPTHVGNTHPASVDVAEQRFIPTHVGNTGDKKPPLEPPPVHPHARGEHSRRRCEIRAWPGSSPRTWGTQAFAAVVGVRVRFIPTHVGNTTIEGALCHATAGSSPRTWGTPS